ncbi:MAG: PQQ-dependent sugar dehydrogenase [Saprospiraceae bacterium]|nr:PQQ-dependent sugar dehydrogenase [Saprospiraceae bacterium]
MKFLKYLAISLPIIALLGFIIYQKYPVNPPIQLSSNPYDGKLPLDRLKLPEGFKIDVYAENVENARSMCLSPNGTLFVGTRGKGNVYALVDMDKDGRSDKQYLLMEGGKMPNGVAFKDGDLYVAEVSRILKFKDIENKLDNPGEPEVIYDQYPTETHHGWKYIAFGPDGRLYVPVGAPCNICKSEDEVFASITSINPDGTDMRVEQEGVRNTVGFDWDPKTDELWFTDNGRDWMGDDSPNCELNRTNNKKGHFGYPYCHQGDLLDPEFGEGKSCDDYESPVVKLGPHTAPLGMEFYESALFPEEYQSDIFVARHGSWNRKEKIGYDVVRVHKELDGSFQSTPFITGWLSDDKSDVWGRPVDIEVMPDGSMLISDDFGDAIYRVYYMPL